MYEIMVIDWKKKERKWWKYRYGVNCFEMLMIFYFISLYTNTFFNTIYSQTLFFLQGQGRHCWAHQLHPAAFLKLAKVLPPLTLIPLSWPPAVVLHPMRSPSSPMESLGTNTPLSTHPISTRSTWLWSSRCFLEPTQPILQGTLQSFLRMVAPFRSRCRSRLSW